MSPVLIVGVLLIAGALFIGYKLIAPTLKDTSQSESVQGFNDAKARVVDSTTQLIEARSGRSLHDRLEKSGSQLRSGEWVLAVAAVTLVCASLGLVRGGVILIVLMILFVPIVAWFLLNRKIRKRQEAFADQLPDFLQMLSSSLRSGQSLPQSVAAIAPDMASPAGDELRRVVIENRIGRDLIDSFRDLALRMDSLDFDRVVRAIDINYRTVATCRSSCVDSMQRSGPATRLLVPFGRLLPKAASRESS